MANPEIVDVTLDNLALKDNRFVYVTLDASQTVVKGQLIGRDSTSKKYKKTASGGSGGSQYVIGLAWEDATTGSGEEQRIVMVQSGDVDERKLVFDGSDTLESKPSGSDYSYRHQLQIFGIFAVATDDAYIDQSA